MIVTCSVVTHGLSLDNSIDVAKIPVTRHPVKEFAEIFLIWPGLRKIPDIDTITN